MDLNELTLYIEIYNWIFSLHFFGEYSISVHVIAFSYYAVFRDMAGPCLFNYPLLLNIKVVPSLGEQKVMPEKSVCCGRFDGTISNSRNSGLWVRTTFKCV